MKINCRTNLDDIMRREQFPTQLPVVPRVGDKIQSATVWKDKIQIELEVVAVTWKRNEFTSEWEPEVELHLPKSKRISIAMWEAHYKYIRSKITHKEYVEQYAAAEKEYLKYK